LKFIFTSILVCLSCLILFAQNSADQHYNLLDEAYKKLTPVSKIDYLITELENFVLIYPNSAQQDEILFRLSNLYQIKKDNTRHLKTLIKLNILHGNSPLVKRSGEIIDSLVTFIPELNLTDYNDEAIRQISNLPFQKDYRLAYLEYLSFLYSAEIKKLDPLLLLEIDQYKKLFARENKDMDAVIFWQANIHKREKNYPAAIFNFNKLYSLYKQSQFVPRSLFELARLNRDYLKNINQARDYLIELINQYPENKVTGDAQFELAQLYEIHYKDHEEALTNYKLQVSAFPKNRNHSLALLRIAYFSEQKEDYEEAVNAFKQIVEDNGDENSISTAFNNLIRIQLELLKDYNLAANTMVLFAQTFPKSEDAPAKLLSAGKLYREKLEDEAKAKEIFGLIIAQYPQSKSATKAEEILK